MSAIPFPTFECNGSLPGKTDSRIVNGIYLRITSGAIYYEIKRIKFIFENQN